MAITAVVLAGVASLGAGAVHAAAIGAHGEQRSLVVVFTVTAAFQLAWGAGVLAIRRPGRSLVVLGALGNLAAVAGWLLAKSTGISFIAGMEEAEAVQLADGAAAGLALLAGVLAAGDLLVPAMSSTPIRRPVLSVVALPVVILTLAAMMSTGTHSHAGGEDHPHDEVAAGPTAANPGAFDPTDTIDLSGVPGVTESQQAEAEVLLAKTLDRLPQYRDVSGLNDRGFYSIGDAVTGDEHYINWDHVNDDRILDPDYPESLVIRHDREEPYLAAAMFMLPEGTTLDDVPEVGGDLVQWHVHSDLCLTDDPVKPRLAFSDLLVGADGACTPPNTKRANVPMLHVWIVSHPCGPFAALEGIGAGQIADGEEKLCTAEHAHAGGH